MACILFENSLELWIIQEVVVTLISTFDYYYNFDTNWIGSF